MNCWYDTWHATFAPRRHPRPLAAWRERCLADYVPHAEIWLSPLPDGAPAGFLVLLPNWIEQLFVAPAQQHRGIGRALIALARFRYPQGLALDTPADNHAAREFYRNRGFAAEQVGFDPESERRIATSGSGTSFRDMGEYIHVTV